MMRQPDECDTTSPAPLPIGGLACPRCGSEKLESWKSIYCCPFCLWAGDEWSIITISRLRGQVKDLEEHIMELAEEAVERLSQREIVETPAPPILKSVVGRGMRRRDRK